MPVIIFLQTIVLVCFNFSFFLIILLRNPGVKTTKKDKYHLNFSNIIYFFIIIITFIFLFVCLSQ